MIGTRTALYLVLVVSALMLGAAEVLRDNSAQTILPAVVAADQLERANGRMWSAETVANQFVGPPLGSLLLAASFVLPFAIDAVSFFAAAGLVALIRGQFRATPARAHPPDTAPATRPSWRAELAEGVRWLWGHRLLRTLAIVLGLINALGMLQLATMVLFAQEVLHTSPLEFSLLAIGGAIGGVLGGIVSASIIRRLGPGPSLALCVVAGSIVPALIGFSSQWIIVSLLFGVTTLTGTVWNVITVSLRQRVIPDHLLGRVNSVYRFFGWGMMPIGTALGGLIVAITEHSSTRQTALRAPWFVAAALSAAVAIYAIPRLTTKRIEAADEAARHTN